VEYGHALDWLGPQQERFTLALGENTVESSKHLHRGRAYATALTRFIAPSQADIVI
jgi:hypothetical protein